MTLRDDVGAERGRPESAAGGGTLEKGLAIVQFVGERGEVTAAAVTEAFGLSRSATYRLLDRLRTGGYLQESGKPGGYRLGPRMVVIGLAALNQMDLMHVAPPLLGPLAQAAGETRQPRGPPGRRDGLRATSTTGRAR